MPSIKYKRQSGNARSKWLLCTRDTDLPKYITYGPTNLDAYKTGEITSDVAAALPSSPDNAALQLPVALEWYAKWETIAAEMYQEMLTE